jgi:adsorption protein B
MESYSLQIAVVVDTALFILAIAYLMLSIDDVLLDCYFYARGLFRRIGKPASLFFDRSRLASKPEARIAIFIPCWHEADVVEQMLTLALRRIEYDRFDIFVGVYPNDPETQAKVDIVGAVAKNVHKVVNPRPGGTTKAQNLNAMYDYMCAMEGDDPFQIIVLHDVEDVIHPLSLRLYNWYMPRKDMLQIPIFPLPRKLRFFTAWTYADEFAENHLKDLVVREAIGAFVPCAGVGCGFGRKCLDFLRAEHGGDVFGDGALTEDYQLSLEIKVRGFNVGFAKDVLVDGTVNGSRARWSRKEYIATRAYFPDTFTTAVRQKTRWITGICLQTWQMRGWCGSLAVRYALYRDRKGMLGHVACFAGYPVMLVAFGLSLWHAADPRVVVAVFRHTAAIYDLLYGVIAVSAWRICQRAIQVARMYGPVAGLVSILRFPWGNVVNGFATFGAVYRYFHSRITREALSWSKTAHIFPTETNDS